MLSGAHKTSVFSLYFIIHVSQRQPSGVAAAYTKMNMWFTLTRLFGRFGVNIQLPFVCFAGFLGYYIEGKISDRYTPGTAPIKQQRQERLLESLDAAPPKKQHDPLKVNLSPSLST